MKRRTFVLVVLGAASPDRFPHFRHHRRRRIRLGTPSIRLHSIPFRRGTIKSNTDLQARSRPQFEPTARPKPGPTPKPIPKPKPNSVRCEVEQMHTDWARMDALLTHDPEIHPPSICIHRSLDLFPRLSGSAIGGGLERVVGGERGRGRRVSFGGGGEVE